MLPPEILDEIFKLLAKDQFSLGACSGAHPVFSQIIEPYFADITVQPPQASLRSLDDSDNELGFSFHAQELLAFLTERPHVSNYVRTFKISKSHIQLPDLNVVATILQMFARLTNITFFYSTYSSPVQNYWTGLPDSFQTAIETCLRLPSMEEVWLANILSFPFSMLDDLPNIKTIRLSNTGGHRHLSSVIHSPLQVLSVETREQKQLDQIFFWARTRQIQSLEFRPHRPLYLGRIIPFLQSSNSTTSLDLDFSSFFQTTYIPRTGETIGNDVIMPPYLANLNHLQRLVVRSQASFSVTGQSSSTTQYSWSLPAISRLIESGSTLEHVALYFHFTIRGALSLSELDWSPLDFPFSSPTLQDIELHFSASLVNSTTPPGHSENVPPATIRSALSRNKHLKNVMEQGLLTIKPEIRKFVDRPRSGQATPGNMFFM